MGTGDWNDGMNRVGHEGRGESVWLAWFLCSVVERFAPLAAARGEHERAARWTEARTGWIAALHDAGWDGAWFRRAFFDNGVPLGSSTNDECRIDLIAQAWSVLSGASDAAYTGPAMAAVKSQLHDEPAGLLQLLAPPFAQSINNPGYIQAYPRGVRENGGQYSHGAVWALMAQALQGDHEAAWQSFEGLSPAHRSRHPERGPVYELEPYVMAGDVYGAAPYVGRGGWSWYTGSAAWLHRAAVETLLGLNVKGKQLSMTPHVPAHWPGFEIALRLGACEFTLQWGDMEGASTPTHQLAAGDWIDWHTLPPNSTVRVLA
jgi:cyclic beta-1,2-glucan synthetase